MIERIEIGNDLTHDEMLAIYKDVCYAPHDEA
jgi:hypothetical protein